MLIVSNLSKSYGERRLFANLSFSIYARDRVGIVGPNGSGKTTLIEIIAGQSERDDGDVVLEKGATIGYLEQNIDFLPDRALLDEVMSVRADGFLLDHKRSVIHDRLEATNDPAEQEELAAELGEIEMRFERAGGYTVESEAKKILSGLGFSPDDNDRTIGEFSGGWKMRVGLAKLLLSEPDILFLDEPTNHLDLEALVWFEGFLNQYDGAALIISHDRAFLNRSVNRVIAFEGGMAKCYTGNYDDYMATREKELDVIEATIRNRERLIEHDKRFIERFRAKNTKASQVQSRIKRIEKMEAIESPISAKTVRLAIPSSPRSGKTVLAFDKMSFGYDAKLLYDSLELTLVRGEKIAFVGPNGAGKSTLLKLMAGLLNPSSGSVTLGHNVHPAYYAQHQMEQLSAGNTVLGEMRKSASGETDERLRTVLGSFLFPGDDVEKKISMLSGGERARLSLAKLFLRPANLILMDEPTNHLDIPSRDVLIGALTEYDGTLCLVTHDRDLIDKTANRIFDIVDGSLTVYHGNYADYVERKERERDMEAQREALWTESRPSSSRRDIDRDRKRTEGDLRNRFYRESKKLRKRIDDIESQIEAASVRMTELEKLLENPEAFSDRQGLGAAIAEYQTLNGRKDMLDTEWLECSMELDSIRDRIYSEPEA